MAQYRFSAQVIGRSSGRSSVAAAAYRAGVSLADERTGLVHDFSRRGGILHTEIIAPDNAPEWMHDRAKLWNAVEKAETRTNSQLAREIQLSLPHELDDAQRRELVRGFAHDQFVSRGMIADIAIHAPGRDGDDRNHHAHIMLTMRELTGAGFHASKATPTARAWNAKENVEQWREAWGEYQNRTFRSLGLDVAVDHRSLTAQGIDREPSVHLGPSANDMERRGKPSRIVAENQSIEARNDARANNDRAAVVVRLDIERLKRAEASAMAERQTALRNAQALTRLDLDQRQDGEAFQLNVALEASYGASKRNLAAAAAAIDSRLRSTGFRKVARDLTGRTERDRQQLAGVRRGLDDIAVREVDARASLARQHAEQREAQKLAQAKAEAAMLARVSTEFERKRRDALRTRREAQSVERERQASLQQAEQRKRTFTPPAKTPKAPAPVELRQERPTPLEDEPVKKDFDRAADTEQKPAPKTPTERKFVSVPAPQPSPYGMIPTPRREAVELPKSQPVIKEPPKREAPTSLRTAAPDAYHKPTPEQTKPAPQGPPAKDWTAKPAQTPQATPAPRKDWGEATRATGGSVPAKDWNEAARDKPREIKPLPGRDRDFDRER